MVAQSQFLQLGSVLYGVACCSSIYIDVVAYRSSIARNIGHIVNYQHKLVSNIEVTDGNITVLTSILAQIYAILCHRLCCYILVRNLFEGHRIGSTRGRNEYGKVLGRILPVLTTCPEREGAIQLSQWCYQPVVGSQRRTSVVAIALRIYATITRSGSKSTFLTSNVDMMYPVVAIAISIYRGKLAHAILKALGNRAVKDGGRCSP